MLKGIAAYVDPLEGSRAQAIERARRHGRYDRLRGLTLVTGHSRQGRSLYLLTETGRTPVPLDVLDPDERRWLFRRTEDGLEPLALWLGNDGLPKQAHGWEKTFQRANERIRQQWAAAHGTDGQDCPLWARPHMARHSFALKWFTILSAVWNQQVEGFTDSERRDLREQFGDVWFQLATLLGHSSPEVTKDWYLEPFTGLQLDYILSLLDEEEQAAVDALLHKVAADSGRPDRLVITPKTCTVLFTEESGRRSKTFDFTTLPLTFEPQVWLAMAFARATGPRGGAKKVSTANGYFDVVRAFASVLAAAQPPPRRPQEITAAHIAAFRLALTPATFHHRVHKLRRLMRQDAALRPEVRRAVCEGRLHRRPLPKMLAYTDAERQQILTAARGDVRRARDRIRAGRDLLARHPRRTATGQCREEGGRSARCSRSHRSPAPPRLWSAAGSALRARRGEAADADALPEPVGGSRILRAAGGSHRGKPGHRHRLAGSPLPPRQWAGQYAGGTG